MFHTLLICYLHRTEYRQGVQVEKVIAQVVERTSKHWWKYYNLRQGPLLKATTPSLLIKARTCRCNGCMMYLMYMYMLWCSMYNYRGKNMEYIVNDFLELCIR